jgi:iron complex outermembrane recepter protein
MLHAVALAICPAVMHAQQDVPRPDSVVVAGAISVHAARPVVTAGGGSALAVRIDSLPVPAAPTLEDVLRRMPLVQVRSNSRGEAQFSLRGSGSDARQVAVLVDGIPLNLGWDHRADLSVLPATAATTLTLVRGLPSVLHGPNVLGGVIEVGVGHHPGRWMPPPSAVVGAGLESTGGSAFTASFAQPFQLPRGSQFAVRAGAGYRARPGVALAGGVAQPAPGPGSEFRSWDPELRTNTDLRHGDGFVALRYLGSDGVWATASSSAFVAERGIAAELHSSAPRYWRYPHVSRSVAVVSGGTGDRRTPLGGTGDLEASLGVDVGRTEIASYEGPDYLTVGAREAGDDRTVTLRLLGDHTVGRAGEVRASFTWAAIQRDEVVNAAAAARYRQRIWSLGAETLWRAASGLPSFPVIRLSAGGAVDGASTPLTGDKPPQPALHDWGARVGASAASAGGALLLHAGVSRRGRFPSLRELYSGSLGRFEPNPSLRAEVLTAAEAGVTVESGAGRLQAVFFQRDLSDAIERVTLPGGRYQRVNRGSMRSTGLELLAGTQAGPFALAGDATLQRVRLEAEPDGTPAAPSAAAVRPEYQPDLLLGGTARVMLPFAVQVGASVRHTGRQYCAHPDQPGQLMLAGSTRTDVDASRDVRLRRGGAFSMLEVRASVDNAADAATYDQCGLPQPGRTFRLQFRAR